ncbi:hypothetical protein E2C01_084706 [Portunus trituberculatus]|uniref:Uncharacterized protein n=1 Tax=Portunus trituberculatus TaxID=210409 RepID=A0A5B7J8F6_PORTR|nr:hypothetical protein [Portunus trituberculatus]
MSILATFDKDEDVTDFVRCKIESLVANNTIADPLSTPGKCGVVCSVERGSRRW